MIEEKKKKEDLLLICPYCYASVTKSNMGCHKRNNCKIFSLWGGKTKGEIDELIKGESIMMSGLTRMNENLMEQNEILNKKIIKLEEENLALKKQNAELEEVAEKKGDMKITFTKENMKTMINAMGVKDSTKIEYLQVWEAYIEWCGWLDVENSRNPFFVHTANDYLKFYYNNKGGNTMTLAKIRTVIQTLLRKLTHRNILLHAFRGTKISKREKNFLSEKQLDIYLDQLKEKKSDTYIAQLIQAKVGGRVNSIANLEKRHLRFLFDPFSTKISLPDTKTVQTNKFINKETREILTQYCEENSESIKDRNGYLFYAGNSNEHSKRAKFLGRKINRELKSFSGTIGLTSLTSHDLRRSFCEISMDERRNKEILKEVSEMVGHKNPYVTKNHYLRKNNISMDEMKEKLVEIYSVRSKDESKSNPEFDSEIESIIELKKIKVQKKLSRKQNFIISEPSQEEENRLRDTLNEALNSKNIKFNDDLVFNVDLNDSESEQVQTMPSEMLKVYKKFKKNSRKGIYGPLEVVFDTIQGYVVKTTNIIEENTLISEYSGTVVEHSEELNSDALMNFLSTENSSFVICPDITGNLARFISGINNSKLKKKKSMQNVNSIMFNIEGSIHVLLYANRKIKKGETLYYDYNAGHFKEYDTSHFIDKE